MWPDLFMPQRVINLILMRSGVSQEKSLIHYSTKMEYNIGDPMPEVVKDGEYEFLSQVEANGVSKENE